MKYDVNHDSLLDVMLLNYLKYSVTDSNLTPEQLWMRVTDAMQHMSQQGIAEFILSHLGHESSYLRVWNLRHEMWKAEAEEYDRRAEIARQKEWEDKFVPPPEAE